MPDMIGGLVQMNAHPVMQDAARPWIGIGIIFVVLFLSLAIAVFTEHKGLFWGFMVLVCIGTASIVYGATLPTVKEIKACAVGQVSIEEIGAKYDVIKVDGKELTLRERAGK